MNTAPTLRELVTRAQAEQGVSMRKLAARAQEQGFHVVGTTLSSIAAGTYKSNPSEETLRAIAWLAGVGMDVTFEAAGRVLPGPPFADELPPGVDNLSRKKRKVVIDLLRVLIEDEAAGVAADDAGPAWTPAIAALSEPGSSRGEAARSQQDDDAEVADPKG